MANTQDLFRDFISLKNFADEYLKLLSHCGWADLAMIQLNLKEHGAITLPLIQIHFESDVNCCGKLSLKSHPIISNQELETQFNRVFDLLKLDFSTFKARTSLWPTDFHSKYYSGNLFGLEDSEYPLFLQSMIDNHLKDLYRDGEGSYWEDDYMISFALRLDFIFSNKPIEFSLEARNYDNSCYGEGHWPGEPIGDWKKNHLDKDVHPVLKLYHKRLNKMYFGQLATERNQLVMTFHSHTQKADKWVSDPKFAYESVKVCSLTSILL